MGAWGTGIFDCDEAMDWLDELCTSDGTDLIAEAFSYAGSGELDSHDATAILCGAAALNIALGHSVPGSPEQLTIWAAGLFEDDIRTLLPDARAAVVRVLGEDSELKDLWQEAGDDYGKWEAEVRGVLAGLG